MFHYYFPSYCLLSLARQPPLVYLYKGVLDTEQAKYETRPRPGLVHPNRGLPKWAFDPQRGAVMMLLLRRTDWPV